MLPRTRTLEIVAGPNGSGKTTFAEAYFRLRNGESRFINPDVIAAGLSLGNEAKAAFHAGRVLLTAVEEAIGKQESFAFESTLSGKTWLPFLKAAKAKKYQIVLYFLYLNRPSLNLKRIQKRVQTGGHAVPKVDVLRRYPRCFRNFWDLYRPLCDDWFIFDNSGRSPLQTQSKAGFEKLSKADQEKFVRLFLEKSK